MYINLYNIYGITEADGLPVEDAQKIHELVKVYEDHRYPNMEKNRYYEGHISLREVNLGIALPDGLSRLEVGCEWGAKTVDVLASRSMFDGYVADSGNEAEALVSRTLPRYLAGATTEAPTPERTAILVPTNALADEVSSQLKASGRPHFKISGTDIFRRPSVKAVLAHLAVARQEHCIVPWARLLAAMGVLPSAACAREFAGRSLQSGVLPGDWMRPDGRSLLADFCQTVREKTLVVFDTETTGLDVDHDDIVQIAAVKMRGGVVLPGSEFDVCLETDRERIWLCACLP